MANSESGITLASVAANTITVDFETGVDHYYYRSLSHAMTADITNWVFTNALEGDNVRVRLSNASGVVQSVTFAGSGLTFVGWQGSESLTVAIADGDDLTVALELWGTKWRVAYASVNNPLT